MDRVARFGSVSATLIVAWSSFGGVGMLSAQNPASTPDASKPAETAGASEPAPAQQSAPAPGTPTPARAQSAPIAPAKAKTASYVIGSLDVLAIKVWNNQNLTGLYDVRPDGMIAIPLVGEVKADGLTPEELRRQLTTKISDYITDPEVSIDIAKINSKKYYIMGEGAARPGPAPLTEPITVMEALASAGGFRDFANLRKIYILRGTQKLNFNYKDVSQGKHLEQNIQIQNGDMIFIP